MLDISPPQSPDRSHISPEKDQYAREYIVPNHMTTPSSEGGLGHRRKTKLKIRTSGITVAPIGIEATNHEYRDEMLNSPIPTTTEPEAVVTAQTESQTAEASTQLPADQPTQSSPLEERTNPTLNRNNPAISHLAERPAHQPSHFSSVGSSLPVSGQCCTCSNQVAPIVTRPPSASEQFSQIFRRNSSSIHNSSAHPVTPLVDPQLLAASQRHVLPSNSTWMDNRVWPLPSNSRHSLPPRYLPHPYYSDTDHSLASRPDYQYSQSTYHRPRNDEMTRATESMYRDPSFPSQRGLPLGAFDGRLHRAKTPIVPSSGTTPWIGRQSRAREARSAPLANMLPSEDVQEAPISEPSSDDDTTMDEGTGGNEQHDATKSQLTDDAENQIGRLVG